MELAHANRVATMGQLSASLLEEKQDEGVAFVLDLTERNESERRYR